MGKLRGMSTNGDGRRIVDFFAGNGLDDRGRSLEQVLGFDDGLLEETHDYIQWLFPLRERSGANPSAPRLDDEAIAAFHAQAQLRRQLRRAFDRMLEFYGLEWCDGAIAQGEDFTLRDDWLTKWNHNHLRITRMLISLRTLGLADEANALFTCLKDIEAAERQTGRRAISETTYQYWQSAMR